MITLAHGQAYLTGKDVNRANSLLSKDYLVIQSYYPDGSIKAELTGRGVAWLSRHRSEALRQRGRPGSPVYRALAPVHAAFMTEQELDHRFVHDPEYAPSVGTKPTGTLSAVAAHFPERRTDYMTITGPALRAAQLKGMPPSVARQTMREIAREYRALRDYDPRRANPEPDAGILTRLADKRSDLSEIDRFGREVKVGDKVKVLVPPSSGKGKAAPSSGHVSFIERGSRPGIGKITYEYPYFDKKRSAVASAYHVLVVNEQNEQDRKYGAYMQRLEAQFGDLKLSKRGRQALAAMKPGMLNYPDAREHPGAMELVAYGLTEVGDDDEGREAFALTGQGEQYDSWLDAQAEWRGKR